MLSQKNNKLFLKALKNTIDFFASLTPYAVSLIKTFSAFATALINWTGVISAIKGISNGFSDIYKYADEKEKDKFFLILNILSIIIYFIYITIMVVALATSWNSPFIKGMSYIVLGITPMKDAYNAFKYWVRFAKATK